MLKNYFTTAVRNLLRRKGYSVINIAGLTLGLACCLIIFQYVTFEYSFDGFNTNSAQLYRVTQKSIKSGREPQISALSGYGMGPALAQGVPEVTRFARIHPDYSDPVIANAAEPEKVFKEERVYYADAAFLHMFSYPLILGDATQALAAPNTMLLSETMARKYFGAESPLGKVLNVNGWIDGAFSVNGVFRDVPANSHLQFDFLLSVPDLLEKSAYQDLKHQWTWSNFVTYVQLRADANVPAVEQKFTEILLRHRGEDYKRTNTQTSLHVQALPEVHLNDAVIAPKAVQGKRRTVYFFMIIALITLVIALMNYVNLATARSLDRSREVGVRKAVGAQRRQLVVQFLFESALTNLAAFVLALVLAEILRPFVNHLAGVQLTDWAWANPQLWAAAFAMFILGTLLAGLYPAFALSSFKPVAVLKAKAGATTTRARMRQGLVVLQFAASVALLAGTVIVLTQLEHMQNLELGINLEQIATVPGPRIVAEGEAGERAMQRLLHELRQLPAVREVATSSALPGRGFNWYSSDLRRENADPASNVPGALAWVDSNFAALYGLELIAGTGFAGISPNTPEGEARPVILNQTASKAVGFDAPEAALQQLITMSGSKFRVVGVFRDFSWSSAHAPIENMLFTIREVGGQLSLKLSTEHLPQTLANVERIYRELFPGNPFHYDFVDEKFAEQYQNDRRFAALFSVFAGLAIVIACLGLFGLASFAAQQRTKEIGIRKVLGASVAGIVALLSQEFVKLILLANLIAAPIAYFTMNNWLQDFAYRIDLGWWIFALAGGLTLLIALLTVSAQAIKAALANPVEALRYE